MLTAHDRGLQPVGAAACSREQLLTSRNFCELYALSFILTGGRVAHLPIDKQYPRGATGQPGTGDYQDQK